MNYEYEIDKLKKAVANLNNTVLQMAKNNTKEVSKTDSTANEVKAITPYTETKTSYIGDTEVVFADLPNGTYNVSFDKTVSATKVTKEVFNGKTSTITVDFEPLEEITNTTISIQ